LLDILARLVFDPTVAGHEISVLRMLGETPTAAATDILARALATADLDLQIEAAWQLSKPHYVEPHRELLATTIKLATPHRPSSLPRQPTPQTRAG
jgi:hypothetical protein